MAGALISPFATVALVLCAAGVAKLRAPGSVLPALRTLGLPASRVLVCLLGLVELLLGATSVAHPTRAGAAAMALLYATFAVVAFVLARRRTACGCFGEADTPASGVQSLLSTGFAIVGTLAAVVPPHGIDWIGRQPLAAIVTLIVCTAGSAAAAVVAYTELPRAWASWSRP